MQLTYKIVENGYIILNDGVEWIEQVGFMPYQGATLEESAANHVAALLNDAEADAAQANDLAQLQEDSAMIAETLALALEEIEQLKAAKGA